MTDSPAPELPPGVGDAGPRIVNKFRGAAAMYYLKSRRIIVMAENFTDARKAIAGLEIKVDRHKMGIANGVSEDSRQPRDSRHDRAGDEADDGGHLSNP